MFRKPLALGMLAAFVLAPGAMAQTPAAESNGARQPVMGGSTQGRPATFLKEEWKNPSGVQGLLSQANVASPDVELTIYGPDPALHATQSSIVFTGKTGDETYLPHMFSGTCETACGVTLRRKTAYADLTSPLARVRINTKMGGLHKVYLMVRLADGAYYVGDKPEGPSIHDWAVSDIFPIEMTWLKIDPKTLLPTGNFLSKIDLGKVDEIGVFDPMPGSGHGAGGSFQLGEIDVYARSVPR